MATDFGDIYLGGRNGPLSKGKLKIAEAGLGWKNASTGAIVTISATDIQKLHWVRVCKDYQLKVFKTDGSVIKFDGFPRDLYDSLASVLKSCYSLNLEQKDLSLRGWNWGSSAFQNNQLIFSVANKTAFEVPLNEVANTSLASKTEVMIEFAPPDLIEANGQKIKEDVLVEMRFFVPGLADGDMVADDEDGPAVYKDLSEQKKVEKDDASDQEETFVVGDDGEALTAAAVFCETIKQKAAIEAIGGEAVVKFDDLLCLTPRSRFEISLYQDFLRLRGKSYDYKVLYKSVTKIFLLPKPDELHWMLVIGLNPPIRQGQTRYPYLVFQFDRDDEIDCDLNMEE